MDDPSLQKLAATIRALNTINVRLVSTDQLAQTYAATISQHKKANSVEIEKDYNVARDVVRSMAHRDHDIEIASEYYYVESLLKLDDAVNVASINIPPEWRDTLSIRSMSRPRLLTHTNVSPCDRFENDEIGFTARTHLVFGGEQLAPTVHFAIGLSTSSNSLKAFRTHGTMFCDLASQTFPSALLAQVINKRVDQKLAAGSLPLPLLPAFFGTQPQYICAEVGDHLSTFAQANAAGGKPRLPLIREVLPGNVFPFLADTVIKIRLSLLIEYIAPQIADGLHSLPLIGGVIGNAVNTEIQGVNISTQYRGQVVWTYPFSLFIFPTEISGTFPVMLRFEGGDGDHLRASIWSYRPKNLHWEWKGLDSHWTFDWDDNPSELTHKDISFGPGIEFIESAITADSLYVFIKHTA